MSRMYKLGMPYMGSKRRLSKPIIDFILEQHPNVKYFYEYVEKLHKAGYIVYVSSYESHMPCVLEIEHLCLLSYKARNKVTEKLFSYYIPKEKIELIQGELF